jgi:hypothetical protein
MRYLFTESQLKHIVRESKEHADDEVIDFNEINLQHEFDKLNDLLFNGELYPIDLMWNRTRSAHGQVKAQKYRSTGKIVIKSLSISKFLAITYRHFKNVLAHEMIHVSLLQKNINAGHDYRFVREMDRINNMNLGFNVTIKADSSAFELSKEVMNKRRKLVVLVTRVDNEDGKRVSVMGVNLYKSSGYRVTKIYEYLTNTASGKRPKYNEVNGDFYYSDNPELQRYSVQKSLSNLSYTNSTDEEVNKLIEDAEWIAGFVTRSGDSTWDGPELPNQL